MFTRNKIHFLLPFCLLLSLIALGVMACDSAANGNSAASVSGMTPGRLWATIDAVVGLASAILAGRALARSAGRIGNGGRNGAIVAMVTGLIVIAYAVLHLKIFTGDFGTGAGRAGAIIAIVMGLTSMVLAGITLARSRRSRSTD
jgi:uncharacterized protein DUF6223